MKPRATKEETDAAVAEHLDKGPPHDIVLRMRTLAECEAFGLASFIPIGGTRVYYVLTAKIPGENEAVAVGILPHGLSVGEFIRQYDEWMDVCGGAEADPDFKGVKM